MPVTVLAIALDADAPALRRALPAIPQATLTAAAGLVACVQTAPPSRDTAWLRRADTAIAALHETATIIPGCLAAPLDDTTAVERSLTARAEHLRHQLARVEGADQWLLRLARGTLAAAHPHPATSPSVPTPTGAAYLRARGHEHPASHARLDRLEAWSRRHLAALLPIAREWCVLAPGELVSHERIALLIPRNARTTVAAAFARHGLPGATLTGPWAPFDFVSEPDPAAPLVSAA